MPHRNARLNVRGRELLVERFCEQGSVAYAARAITHEPSNHPRDG